MMLTDVVIISTTQFCNAFFPPTPANELRRISKFAGYWNIACECAYWYTKLLVVYVWLLMYSSLLN
jgi:hypothetical protein